jgi:hypothetical protein
MRFSELFVLQAAAVYTAVAGRSLSRLDLVNDLTVNRHLLSRNTAQRLEYAADTPGSFLPLAVIEKDAPSTTIPEVQDLKPILFPNAKRTKIRYGPYRLPNVTIDNWEKKNLNVSGMLNNIVLDAKKPCTECVVLGMNAGIEYADGTEADTTNDAWFHHLVLLNTGPTTEDPVCGWGKGESFFESGNERSYTTYVPSDAANIKSGYKVAKDDKFTLVNELVNTSEKDKFVWVTLNFEYLDGDHPDYKSSKIIWLSIGPTCGKVYPNSGPSNVTVAGQPREKIFSEHSGAWTSRLTGTILSTGGHLHDGGLSVDILHNDQVICDSVATYGKPGDESASLEAKKHAMADGMAGMAGDSSDPTLHIASMTGCTNLGAINPGDTLSLVANYDFNQHKGVVNNKGELDEIMGMAAVLLAI